MFFKVDRNTMDLASLGVNLKSCVDLIIANNTRSIFSLTLPTNLESPLPKD